MTTIPNGPSTNKPAQQPVPLQSSSNTRETDNGLDEAKKVIIDRMLTYMFDPMFGVADYLKIAETNSLEDFSSQFSPHGARAIRIALSLKEQSSQDEVKQALDERLSESLETTNSEETPDDLRLIDMPPEVTIEDVNDAEKVTDPQFAKLFGLNETATRNEISLAGSLVLSVLQREHYGLEPSASDQELADAMMATQ